MKFASDSFGEKTACGMEVRMQEKRKYKRVPVDMKLNISNLFKQDNVLIRNVDAPIEVINISKAGIGFLSKAELPVGFYFNSKIQLGDSESVLYAVVRIVRVEKREDSNMYGCEFVGLAPVLEYIFDDYEKTLEN